MPGGAPTLYDPKYCEEIIEYFRKEPFSVVMKKEYFNDGKIKSETPISIATEFPTIERFADKIGVHKDTIYEWVKVHEEFSDAFTRAHDLQKAIWKINGLQGLYNAQFAQFVGKNCFGWSDKTEVEYTEKTDLTDEQIDARIKELMGKAGAN